MQLKEVRISGLYLRGYLAGLRKITGNQYPKMLTLAGLGQFAEKYPPAVDAPVASAYNLACLHQVIADYISPELHDMFLRNLGRSFAQNAINTPGLREAVTKIGAVREDIKLFEEALQVIARVIDKTVLDGRVLLEKDPEEKGWLFIYTNCLNCVNQSRCGEVATCTAIPAFYKELIPNLTGVRVQVEEVKCGSTSDNSCEYLVTTGKFFG